MKSTKRCYAPLMLAGVMLLGWELACRLDRAGLLRPVFPTLNAQPNPACPGEPVTIEWDLNLPEGQLWCTCVNGAYRPDPIECLSSSDCPRGETCLDNYCCNRDYCGSECGNPGQSCKADFEAELVIDGASTPISEETGSTTITPEDDTTVMMSGRAIAGEDSKDLDEASITIHVLEVAERDEILIYFPWICPTTRWEGIELEAREFVEIVSVRNPGPYRVRVTVKKVDYNGPPVELMVGGSTEVFNGVFAGEWSLELLDPVVVPVTDCLSSLTASDRLPPPGSGSHHRMLCRVTVGRPCRGRRQGRRAPPARCPLRGPRGNPMAGWALGKAPQESVTSRPGQRCKSVPYAQADRVGCGRYQTHEVGRRMSLVWMRAVRDVVLATTVCLFPAALVPGSPPSWPSFRGPRATGRVDAQHTPTTWNAETGANIKWKTPLPGLAHASPIVWGDRVFITSAVSSDPEPYLRVGLYGESPDHPEKVVHHYRVYCLDKTTGTILWEQTAHSGTPQVKRHIKSSHANSTPATDGKHVVAFFGSEGLYCFDLEGELLWEKDLGYLDAGAFDAPEIQWGFGSSPIIYHNMVIVLCDVNNQSFMAAFDLETGQEIWRTLRDEVPTWGTPTVHESQGRRQVIVNGWKHIGGYDVLTGKELWRMRGGGDIPVPTPFVAHGLIFITNAHGGGRPIYAIRTEARGDISLKPGETSNRYVAWSRPRRGSYIPTTIVYGEYLYVGDDRGILTCYQAMTGQQVYRTRIADRGESYSASPVAADGKLYFTSEDGDIHVVRAGPEFKLLATNSMGEECLATPAISEGMIFVRTRRHLFGIGGQGG